MSFSLTAGPAIAVAYGECSLRRIPREEQSGRCATPNKKGTWGRGLDWCTLPKAVEVDRKSPVVRESPRRSVVPSSVRQTVVTRSEEHTSELQSLRHLVCRLLLEKKK